MPPLPSPTHPVQNGMEATSGPLPLLPHENQSQRANGGAYTTGHGYGNSTTMTHDYADRQDVARNGISMHGAGGHRRDEEDSEEEESPVERRAPVQYRF